MEAASQSAATPAKEQSAPEQIAELEQSGGFGLMRSLSLGGGSGGNKPKPTVTPGNILQLQRMVGNQAVQRLINAKKSQSQTKSAVQRVFAPTVSAYVARDGDYNNDQGGGGNDAQAEQQDAPAAINQVVQVTDINALDDVPDDADLPPQLNELENNVPPPPSDDGPGDYNGGGGGAYGPNSARQLQSDDNEAQGGYNSDNQGGNNVAPVQANQGGSNLVPVQANNQNAQPKADKGPVLFNKTAYLDPAEFGEDQGQGYGNDLRKRHVIHNTNVDLRTVYLTKTERRAYRISVQGGVFKDSQGGTLDSNGAINFNKAGGEGLIFVMSRRGKLYAADMVAEYYRGGYNRKNDRVLPGLVGVKAFHHSSFKSGDDVAGAGELKITSGKLKMVSDASGHYKPTAEHTMQVLQLFKSSGVNLEEVRLKLILLAKNHNIADVCAQDFMDASGNLTKTKELAEIRKKKEIGKADPWGNGEYREAEDGKYKITLAAHISAPSLFNALGRFIKTKGKDQPVGHTWLRLKDANGGALSYGFYPNSGQVTDSSEGGSVRSPDPANDPEFNYDYEVSADQHAKAITYAESKKASRPRYSVFSYNCTTFAVEAVRAAGINPPDSTTLGVDNPNKLVESIEKMKLEEAKTNPVKANEQVELP